MERKYRNNIDNEDDVKEVEELSILKQRDQSLSRVERARGEKLKTGMRVAQSGTSNSGWVGSSRMRNAAKDW